MYGGGGNSGATFNHDFIELVQPERRAGRRSTGWSVQYASAAGVDLADDAADRRRSPPAAAYWSARRAARDRDHAGHRRTSTGTIADERDGRQGRARRRSTTALACGGVELRGARLRRRPRRVRRDRDRVRGQRAGARRLEHARRSRATRRSTNTANNAADFTAGAPTPTPGVVGSTADRRPRTAATIAEIQGTGAASPLVGQTVTTDGVVTAAYPTGGLNGYVIQTPGTGRRDRRDATARPTRSSSSRRRRPARSRSVTTSRSPARSASSTASPRSRSPRRAASVMLAAAGAGDPGLGRVADDRRRARGARVDAVPADRRPDDLQHVLARTSTARSASRRARTPLLQPDRGRPSGLRRGRSPSPPTTPRAASCSTTASSTNFLSRGQPGLTPPYISLTNPVRVGAAATFTAPVVVDFRNNVWKLNPTAARAGAPVTFENDRTAAPAAVGGDLKVASFNVLNYFTTLGATTAGCTSFKDRTGDPVTVNGGLRPARRVGPGGPAAPAGQDRRGDQRARRRRRRPARDRELARSSTGSPTRRSAPWSTRSTRRPARHVWAFVPSSTELPAGRRDGRHHQRDHLQARPPSSGPATSRALGTQSDDDEAFGNAREPIGQVFTPVGGGDAVLRRRQPLQVQGLGGSVAGRRRHRRRPGRLERVARPPGRRRCATGSRRSRATRGRSRSSATSTRTRTRTRCRRSTTPATPTPRRRSPTASTRTRSAACPARSTTCCSTTRRCERATGADIWEINAEESIALEYSRYNYHGTLFYAPDVVPVLRPRPGGRRPGRRARPSRSTSRCSTSTTSTAASTPTP